ncbi:RNA polymerase sigma-70 factor [uncultured Bacteroides sp.]|uniref:RNA polymerase sigma-70 factor n=1 Tax=uncultured Bacteroides sp. TaxID=162156 RepID=UPI00266FCDA8|nr:RNA polymerase sigma-70 factor [uncultured Bacteroides sp.]
MQPFNEKQLLEAISKGDEKAFKVLFLYYYPRVKGFIGGLLQSSEEVEDISQDIFLMLWNHRSSFVAINNFKSYLFRICKNAVYRHIERTLLFKNYLQKQTENMASIPECNETDDNIQLQELELLIAITVEKMPPQRKKIYKMSRESGMSNDEIAHTLGLNKRTIENHLSQALTDLRKVLSIAFILFF